MSLFSVTLSKSQQRRLSKSHLYKEAEQSKSWWVRLRFIGLWNMLMWLNLCTSSKILKMCIFFLSFAQIIVLMNFWKDVKDCMSLKSSAILCRLLMLSNIFIPTELFIEISNSAIYSSTIKCRLNWEISVLQPNSILMEKRKEQSVVHLTILLLKFWRVELVIHMK